MATPVKRNFCLAPFTQITYSPTGNYSPCPEIGGRAWSDADANIVEAWNSLDFQSLRKSFNDNEQNTICNRCWGQESTGKQSLRKRLFTTSHLKENIINFIQEDFKSGPKQINLIVGNLCNLRCRICAAGLSVTFNKEGEYYEKKHNLTNTRYTSPAKKAITFTAQQIEQLFELSGNLIRLEFYGGEPLLDEPTLDLLEKLIAAGRSKNIVLFYNTNSTVNPSDRQYKIWNQFKSIEFNLSYDDIDSRYTYHRHPAKWKDAILTFNKIKDAAWQIPVQFQIICTISALNVYYLNDIIIEFKNMKLPYFLNTLSDPDYYDLRYLPIEIKQQLIERVGNQFEELKFVKNMLAQPTDNNQWELFKFWTKEKDLYREESFKDTFPEYYTLLNNYDSTF